MFGTLTTPQMLEILLTQPVGRLACNDAPAPYVVPVSYAFEGGCVYIYSMEGRKLALMRKDPNVRFLVDDTEQLSNWKSVLCEGLFEELTSTEQRLAALNVLGKRKIPFVSSKTMRISPEWPFDEEDMSQLPGVFFRIVVKEMTGRFEQPDKAHYYAT